MQNHAIAADIVGVMNLAVEQQVIVAADPQSEVQGLLFDMITAAEEQGIEVPTYR